MTDDTRSSKKSQEHSETKNYDDDSDDDEYTACACQRWLFATIFMPIFLVLSIVGFILVVLLMPCKYQSILKSHHVRESRFRSPENLESGIQFKEFGIPLTIEIRNPSSTFKESVIQYLESGIHDVDFRTKTVWIPLHGAIDACSSYFYLFPGQISNTWENFCKITYQKIVIFEECTTLKRP